jgi:hypothetical protein
MHVCHRSYLDLVGVLLEWDTQLSSRPTFEFAGKLPQLPRAWGFRMVFSNTGGDIWVQP